jgi:hypothetical protein
VCMVRLKHPTQPYAERHEYLKGLQSYLTALRSSIVANGGKRGAGTASA